MDESFRAVPSSSETLVIAFSAKQSKPGEFHLHRPLETFSCQKLFVRDPSGLWWNAGLPGAGDTVNEIVGRIETEIGQLHGVKRVITVGPSMGAYGAILFGCLLGAERVIALAPQTYLSRRLQTDWLPKSLDLQVPDLAPVIRQTPSTHIELVAGWDDTLDVFHAQRIAGLPSVRVLALPGRTHLLALELHREGKLESLLTALVQGDIPESAQVNPSLDADIKRRIEATVFARAAGDWRAVATAIEPVAERHHDWAGPNFDLGRGLIGIGKWSAAEAVLRRVIHANPRLTEPRIALASILRERGHARDATAVIHDGLTLDPDWREGHIVLEEGIRCKARWYTAGKEIIRSQPW